jgi:hypothetical protein
MNCRESISPEADLASAFSNERLMSRGGPFMHDPVAVMIGSV